MACSPSKSGAAMEHPTQAKCPYCLSSEGYVRRVTLTADERLFTFICADCRRIWNGEPHAYEAQNLQLLGELRQQSNLRLVRSQRSSR